MTLEEAARRYKIPPQVVEHYTQRTASREIDDRALERLSLMTTLCTVGFSNAESARYLDAESDQERLALLEDQRHTLLTEIHSCEHALTALDVLRHQLRQNHDNH